MKTLPISAALACSLAAAPASAQEPADGEREPGYIVTVGAGAQAYPRYPGADELAIGPMPIVGIRREGRPLSLEAPDEGWGFGLLGRDSRIDFGPAVQFQTARREEDVGAAVGRVGFTVEAGGFVELFPAENLRFRVEARQGIGGHRGLVGDLGADLFAASDQTIFSIGPRVRLGDNRYTDAYFGVTPAVAARTGLAAFNPGAGIHSYGATAGLRHEFAGGFGVRAYTRYDRLAGDAADSPIVRRFGSRDQFSAGVGLSYSFTVRGRRRR